MQRRDYFYRRAKREGYRSRASFKLQQINERFEIIRQDDAVIDLGAAPGGWLQVAKEISGGFVLGVDLKKIEQIEGVETIKGDINSDLTLTRIRELIEVVDVVICDASPNLSGNWSYDHARSIDLATSALNAAEKILKPNGNFVVKVFQGSQYTDFVDEVQKRFEFVKAYTPKASRRESAEIYVIGKRFKRCTQI